jgi:CMP/dCMP kinase
MIITIDGPAGAGKTTISKMLARRLGYRYIDTGALYRGIALAACQARVAADDDGALATLCRNITLDFQPSDQGLLLILNGKDVGDQIRTPEVTMMASAISARPVIRAFLLEIQRTLGASKKVVLEGRDMGTVVFPQADIKFFLDADPKIRARRRYEELKAKNCQCPSLDCVEKEMVQRDTNDSSRTLAPLKPAQDAIHIDSTRLALEQVVVTMLNHIASKNS